MGYYVNDFREIIGNVAVVTTILQFLSGIVVCRRYVANGSTGDSSPLPFTCGVLSCGLWFLYGLTKPDRKIILVNAIGVALMLAYTITFFLFTMKKMTVLKQVLISLLVLGASVCYVNSSEDTDAILNNLGILASFLTLLTIAAPLSNLFYVFKVRSTESLPFPLILMSFLVCMMWFMYGILHEDVYITRVNFIGAVLATCQLSLFMIFPNTPPSPIITKGIIANMLATLTLTFLSAPLLASKDSYLYPYWLTVGLGALSFNPSYYILLQLCIFS